MTNLLCYNNSTSTLIIKLCSKLMILKMNNQNTRHSKSILIRILSWHGIIELMKSSFKEYTNDWHVLDIK